MDATELTDNDESRVASKSAEVAFEEMKRLREAPTAETSSTRAVAHAHQHQDDENKTILQYHFENRALTLQLKISESQVEDLTNKLEKAQSDLAKLGRHLRLMQAAQSFFSKSILETTDNLMNRPGLIEGFSPEEERQRVDEAAKEHLDKFKTFLTGQGAGTKETSLIDQLKDQLANKVDESEGHIAPAEV